MAVATKPFDEGAVCPKCGNGDVTVRYSSGRASWRGGCSDYRCSSAGSGEHLDRVCQRCRYQWAEVPLPALPPSERARGGTVEQADMSDDEIPHSTGRSVVRGPRAASAAAERIVSPIYDHDVIFGGGRGQP